MTENEKSGVKPEKASAKDEPQNYVIEDYDVKVRCITSANGIKTCKIQEISVDVPNKNPAPDVPAASSQKDAPVAAVPAATPVTSVPATPAAAVSRQLPDVTAKECDLCNALEAALKEKVEAAAQSTPAPRQQLASWDPARSAPTSRRQFSPRDEPRRRTV